MSPVFIDYFPTDYEDERQWIVSLTYLLEERNWAGLFALFNEREKYFNDALFMAGSVLLDRQFIDREKVRAAILAYKPNETLVLYDVYFYLSKACLFLSENNLGKACEYFNLTFEHLFEFPQLSENVAYFSTYDWMSQQLDLYFSAQKKYLLESEQHKNNKLGDLRYGLVPESNDQAPLFFTSCDLGYLKRFGEDFVRVISPHGPIHIHVVGRENEIEFEKYQRNAIYPLSFSFEEDEDKRSVYYACLRFLALSELMSKTNRDIAIVDIDISEVNNLDILLEKSRDKDVTCFEINTYLPWLRYAAGYIYLKRNSNLSHAFADRISNLLQNTIQDAKWMADQNALYRVIYSLIDDFSDERFQFLGGAQSNEEIGDYFNVQISITEKSKLQKDMDYMNKGRQELKSELTIFSGG